MGEELDSSGKGDAVGIDHFCFEIDAVSIEDVIADLQRAGIGVVRGPTERRDDTAVLSAGHGEDVDPASRYFTPHIGSWS